MSSAPPSGQAGSPLRVVQLTDFHLLADPANTMMGVDTEETFLAVLRAARESCWPTDLLLLTGDLVQDAKPSTYARLGRHLNGLQAPCLCLPGNHDDPDLIQDVLGRGGVRFESSILLDGWQVICLDSTIPHNPAGHLRPDQLEVLDRLLAEYPDRHAVISLHHSPLPTGSAWLDTMMLDNAEELFERLDRHPRVRGVVFGHVHQAMDFTRGAVRLLACPSTCFQFKPASNDFALDAVPPGYRWLSLYPNGEIETGVERLDEVPAGLDMASGGY